MKKLRGRSIFGEDPPKPVIPEVRTTSNPGIRNGTALIIRTRAERLRQGCCQFCGVPGHIELKCVLKKAADKEIEKEHRQRKNNYA